MGTIYEEYTVAQLERVCHRKGTERLSPTALATLAIKIVHLIDTLVACDTLEARVDLLIHEFELDDMPISEAEDLPYSGDMTIEVRQFDSYGAFMSEEIQIMQHGKHQEALDHTIKRFMGVQHRREDHAWGGGSFKEPEKRVVLLYNAEWGERSKPEYIITLRRSIL